MSPRTPRARRLLAALPWALAALGAWAWAAQTGELLLGKPLRWAALLLVVRALAVGTSARARVRGPLRRIRWPGWTPAVITALVVGVAAWRLLPTVMTGLGTLAGWDFPVHAWHANLLATELFPGLRGWTFSHNFGWAEGDDYSLLPYLPAAWTQVLTGGAVGVDAFLAVQVALLTAGFPLVVALYLGRGLRTWPVVCGALLLLLDPGIFHQGGLVPLLVAGVWPFRLSMLLCVAALWCADRVLHRPSPARVAVYVLVLAAAVNSHVAGITYAAATLLYWWVARQPARAPAWTWGLLLAGAAAAAASAGWLLVPFNAMKAELTPWGDPQRLLPPFAERAFALSFFERMSALEAVLAAAGTVLLWRRGAVAARWAVGGLALGTLWLGVDVVEALAPRSLQETAELMQWPRYWALARLSVLFAAGVAVAQGARWAAAALLSRRRPAVGVLFGVATVAVAVAALDLGWRPTWNRSHLKRVADLPRVDDLPYAAGLLQAAQQVRNTGAADALLIVDMPTGGNAQAHLPAWVNRHTGVRVAGTQRLHGTFVFRDVGPQQGQHTYAEMTGGGATHWVKLGAMPPGPGAVERGVFPGDVHLWELPRLAADHRVATGMDGVRVTRFDRQAVVLELPPTGGALAVRARWHPRWRVAEGPGVILKRASLFPSSRQVFIRLEVPPGVTRVVLEPGPLPAAGRGWTLTALGIALGAAVVLVARRRWAHASSASSSASPPAPAST
ncbi:MAG: hypothetical protein HY904_12475 [Deltaproteobacteria bacterium]|nr:hypothetical protein [Deltaproteobacteria bacterium]